MPSEPEHHSPPGQPAAAPPPPEKVRLRFAKAGDLRLVSHHDLMHVFERMCRRAGVRFHSTQGFHPKPKMAFALSLALGLVGRDEVLELEVQPPLDPDDLRRRLAAQAPPGLEILSARRVDRRAGARVRSVRYRVPVPPAAAADLRRRADDLLAAAEHWVWRTRPRRKRLNLRPLLRGLSLGGGHLEIDLWVTPDGTARPEEILQALGADALTEGAVLERSRLELYDETDETDDGPPGPPPAHPGPGGGAGGDGPGPDRGVRPPRGRTGPLLPGPLSFDS